MDELFKGIMKLAVFLVIVAVIFCFIMGLANMTAP